MKKTNIIFSSAIVLIIFLASIILIPAQEKEFDPDDPSTYKYDSDEMYKSENIEQVLEKGDYGKIDWSKVPEDAYGSVEWQDVPDNGYDNINQKKIPSGGVEHIP
ncbi:MAG: hypothetical protein R6U32_06460, partial [Candidatus Woesearchaeota archaeon]